jgi:hypothetical protein
VHDPGETGWFELAAILKRDRVAYVLVLNKLAAGTKPQFADEDVAKLMKVSSSTIGRSYRRFSKFRGELQDKSEGEDEDA